MRKRDLKCKPLTSGSILHNSLLADLDLTPRGTPNNALYVRCTYSSVISIISENLALIYGGILRSPFLKTRKTNKTGIMREIFWLTKKKKK